VNDILSDYDGTLCPTTSVRGDSSAGGTVSEELEQLLFSISKCIPVCIISSKDFVFLHKRTRFANILSCVLGIETIIHNLALGCKYMLDFNQLPLFLRGLIDHDFIFSENLLPN
jgi:hypothetical protein